ncbi:MAG: lipid-A-disaccharide synthase, partial [Calditrichaeota bacterium]
MGKRILIIAGEVSGDRHAADLVRVLRAERSEWQFVGIGGERMEQAGVQLLYHISQMAFLGFAEVVRHLPFIRRVLRTIRARLREGVDAVILVDYPGFNLRVARMAHALGVPVIYYISPQLWAWGERRVEKMRRHVDLLLVIFRFEVDFYARHGITAHFVGHPMVDQIHISQSEAEFRRRLGIPGDVPVVGLFPGSREMEVRQLLPVMMRAV